MSMSYVPCNHCGMLTGCSCGLRMEMSFEYALRRAEPLDFEGLKALLPDLDLAFFNEATDYVLNPSMITNANELRDLELDKVVGD